MVENLFRWRTLPVLLHSVFNTIFINHCKTIMQYKRSKNVKTASEFIRNITASYKCSLLRTYSYNDTISYSIVSYFNAEIDITLLKTFGTRFIRCKYLPNSRICGYCSNTRYFLYTQAGSFRSNQFQCNYFKRQT